MISIQNALRDIRNLGLILAEIGAQTPHIASSPEGKRIVEFADAIVQQITDIQQGTHEVLDAAKIIHGQSEPLEKLARLIKASIETQMLSIQHIQQASEEIQHDREDIASSLKTIAKSAEGFLEETQAIQTEAQQLLDRVKQLHELVKTAKLKQQILRDHHITDAQTSSEEGRGRGKER